MKTPIRYSLRVTVECQRIALRGLNRLDPKKVLHCGQDSHGTPSIWIEMEMPEHDSVFERGATPPDVPASVAVEIFMVPTGGRVPDCCTHLGTIVIPLMGEVWHVYATNRTLTQAR